LNKPVSALVASATAAANQEAKQIMADVEGIQAVVIATADGFDVASQTREGIDPERIAAMASSIAAISQVVSHEAQLGRSRSVTIDTDAGFAVVYNIHRSDIDLVINVVANERALLGQVIYRTAAAARMLAEV
jgi:predicted regulator of Ras-like GTPase activity (Roadblock/LC7/MglB family)